MVDTLTNMEAVCSKLQSEVEEINRSLLLFPSSSELLNEFYSILKTDSQDVSMTEIQTTPIEKPRAPKFNPPRTPNSPRNGAVDFDAFSQTPTLAQIGISDSALAIVGEGGAKSKLAQMSDTDSEYKISPTGSLALSMVNTIPSIPLFPLVTLFSTVCPFWPSFGHCHQRQQHESYRVDHAAPINAVHLSINHRRNTICQ